MLRAFFEGERLVSMPVQHSKRLIVLRALAETVFERKRKYPEKEVNQRLAVRHPDAASLRRYLVDEGFMTRKSSVYRLRPRRDWPDDRRAQRSRARVARPDTAAAPASYRARAQPASVAPVVTTSSTRIIHRPAPRRATRVGAKAWPTLLRACAPAELVLGSSPLCALERMHTGRPRLRPGAREQLGLIEAALAPSLSVDGHRHEHIATDGRAAPTLGHQLGQWLDEAQLAVVLERMQGGSRGPVNAAHHSSWTMPSGWVGAARVGASAGSSSRRAMTLRHAGHSATPSRLQPGHVGGSSRSSNAFMVVG